MARGRAPDGERIGKVNGTPPAEDTRARVGEVLRRAYDEALAEPVPDAFADLLRRLD